MSEVWSYNALKCPGKLQICMAIHPTSSKTKLVSSLHDTGSESLLGIRKTEHVILRYE
jgi:hypothetical protein